MKNDSIEIIVYNNDIESALKKLKRGLVQGMVFTTLKMRAENPSRNDRKKNKKRKAEQLFIKQKKKR
jgi:ribosomal protein S21